MNLATVYTNADTAETYFLLFQELRKILLDLFQVRLEFFPISNRGIRAIVGDMDSKVLGGKKLFIIVSSY